ncbi:DUF1616 domain-containing protein [Methanogenium sp. S4BF]|uniref:DUF1616 domain-containing protein n=1 Tax=Methanogenium sp. S4BF TaxID=1789226 RepID=UPI002416E3E9|nr:DUF1616 domain-containing protein [Methanogenium sp. S4BF]WFN35340.1 DUF1616 domain-containing protein [Methanogenium sp. S4BF]
MKKWCVGGVCGEEKMTAGTSNGLALHRFMIVVLGIVLLFAIAAIVFVILVPIEGEHYTEFYLLGKDGVAAGYPERIRIGEPETVIIGIHNHEYRDVAYQVEVYLLDETTDWNESVINAMAPLDEFRVNLSHDQNEERMFTFFVNETEYNRLEFLLFNEKVPPEQVMGEERINASYRDLHLWIQVE